MSGSAAQFVLLAAGAILAGCVHSTCDTGLPPAEQVELSAAEWDSITNASGELKNARALDMCDEKLSRDSDHGRYYVVDACGNQCLACSWEPGCKY